ncbi:MAG: tyrosine-type recombinase/integrase [Xanthobacter sp.]
MALQMVRPTRRKGSSKLRYHRRVPKALRGFAQGHPISILFPASGDEPEYTAKATLGKDQVSFSLGTGNALVAKERNAIADQYMERLFSTLEAQKVSGGGLSLTFKQCRALAGQWYAGFITSHEDDPPAMEALKAHALFLSDMDHYVIVDDEGQKHYDPGLLRFVRREMLVPNALAEPNAETWAKLVQAVVQTILQALGTVTRYAEGDYSPDPVPSTFPVLDLNTLIARKRADEKLAHAKVHADKEGGGAQLTEGGTGYRPCAGALTFSTLLDQWWASVQPTGIALSTHTAYKAAFRALARHVGHEDARRIVTADIEAFRDARLAEGKAHRTVNTQQEAIKSVYGWAVEKKILETNPAKGVTMPKRRQVVTLDRDFSEAEAKAILKAASAVRIPAKTRLANVRQVKNALAKRWVPWLCAYTGARAGEIVQLRKQDIQKDDNGGWFINITPDAGTVKSKHFREVPLHAHLIDQGFIKFVQGAKDGHLFLSISLDADDEEKAKARTVAIQGLATFAKKAGNLPAGRQPNHAWRHTFKTKGTDAGVSDKILDAICGHAPSTVGASYGKVSLKVKREAINRLPRWSL